MEQENDPNVAALLDSLSDLAVAAELINHEINEIATETDERVGHLMTRIDAIANETDVMVTELQATEARISEELDELMLGELSDVEDAEEPST